MKTAISTAVRAPTTALRARQRGISLYVVLIVVLLSMLLALWASRTALFNEMVVGNDADYQRAFEAAQAMIQDAELDIRRERPDGNECQSQQADGKVCRASPDTPHLPAEDKEVGPLLDLLGEQPSGCLSGLCQKFVGSQDFWNDSDTLAVMTQTNVGARFGEFTGATVGAGGSVNTAASILKDTSAAKRGAWYWIEVLPFDSSGTNQGGVVVASEGSMAVLPLHVTPAVAYRITALAWGRKAGAPVVLQQTYVRQKLKD